MSLFMFLLNSVMVIPAYRMILLFQITTPLCFLYYGKVETANTTPFYKYKIILNIFNVQKNRKKFDCLKWDRKEV